MKLYGDSSCARMRKSGNEGKIGDSDTSAAVPAARTINSAFGAVRFQPKIPNNNSGAAKTKTVARAPPLAISQKVGRYTPRILPTVKANEMPPDTRPKCGFCNE